jgi:hypothetical protein
MRIARNFFVLALFVSNCYSQDENGSVARAAGHNLSLRIFEINATNEFFEEAPNSVENAEGSPYFNENFIKGSIFNGKDLIKENVLLRYNIYADEIEIKKYDFLPDDEISSLTKDPRFYVKILNNIFVFATYQQSIEKGGYFKVIQPGKHYDLYKKIIIDFTPFKSANAIESEKPAAFKRTQDYYLVTKKGNFFKIPKRTSKIYTIMDGKEKKIKDFIKKNKLNLKIEKDLVQLVNYYNSIL